MDMKQKRVITICILLITFPLLLFPMRSLSRQEKESKLYLLISDYRTGNQSWSSLERDLFPVGSAEERFLLGMDAFTAGDYEGAKELFYQAHSAPSSDPALPTYLYFYCNSCTYYLEGKGDPKRIAQAFDAAGQYRPLANDADMLWDMVGSIALGPEGNQEAITLLETYLQKTENLDLTAWTKLKNYVGVLEYLQESYAKSIRAFYDVQLKLEHMKERPMELQLQLSYAEEYIANIYSIFEDYERAVILYQEAANHCDISNRYTQYLNMSMAYMELSDLENAKKSARMAEELLPYLDPDAVPEVQASIYDTLANIYIKEGNYAEADRYLTQAETIYQQNPTAVLYGGEYVVLLSRCKYLVQTGELEKAQHILEDMLQHDNISYYGLEKDIYESLVEIYQKTGQNTLLIPALQHLLTLDKEFSQTTQREYLEFSKYYRDANRLQIQNANLTRVNIAAILSTLTVSVTLFLVLLLVRLLRKKNVTDQLTGIYNRKKLTLLTRNYERMGTPGKFGVIMLDIDYFKRYNDTYGHPAGDAVLKEVAKTLVESVRKSDLVIRYGGEEFLILLNGVQAQTAQDACRRIHQHIAERAIPHVASEVSDHVTLSIGLCYQEQSSRTSLSELIKQADECLYQSKQSGRNCFSVIEI